MKLLSRVPRRAMISVAALALAALAVTGSLALLSKAHGPTPVVVDQHAAQVAANGIVEGVRPEVALRPEIAGVIVRVCVRENDDVEAGQLLVELANDTHKCQVALAQAELASSRAQFEQIDSDHRRSQRLIGTRSISQEQHDTDHYRKQIAQAKLQEAEARLGLAKADLAKTQLRAPTAGKILQVYAEPGEAVGPRSPQPILRLADLSRRRVRAFIEELDVAQVRTGQRATVTADGWPGREFPGTVTLLMARMGRRAPESDAPGEYKDVYFREVLIDLDEGAELPLNLRVQLKIGTGAAPSK